MRIFVLGLGKSGTTALLHKLAASIPNARAYSGGTPGRHRTSHDSAVIKHTFNPDKGRTFDVFRRHFAEQRYDRKIWIARDPRDQAISAFLYRWYWALGKDPGQYRACLARVREKERAPRSVPFHELFRFHGEGGTPQSRAEMSAAQTRCYEAMQAFVAGLGEDWLIFRYEDMVDARFEALEAYLGLPVAQEAEVPSSERRIARRKRYGDWRDWYTVEDREVFEPIYRPYMEQIGYDADDWALRAEPVIDPRHASLYMESLARREPLEVARRLRKKIVRRGGRIFSSLFSRAPAPP